jgi:hypothetical protein
MGGAPVQVTVFRNGILVGIGACSRTFLTDATMLERCHQVIRTAGVKELENRLWGYDPEFKPICDAFPAIDTLDVDDKSNEDYAPMP